MVESHPGKSLESHHKEVRQIGSLLLETKENTIRSIEIIKEILPIILENHDLGKATTYFGEYLRNPNKVLNGEQRKNKSHAMLSAWIVYYKVEQKLLLLGENDLNATKWAFISCYIVNKHHADLGNINQRILENDVDEELIKRQFTHLREEAVFKDTKEKEQIAEFMEYVINENLDKYWILRDDIEQAMQETHLIDYILVNYLFSILVTSDKGTAIYHSNQLRVEQLAIQLVQNEYLSAETITRYKEIKWGTAKKAIDKEREEIAQQVRDQVERIELNQDRILSLHVPTGYGKTLAALHAACILNDRLQNQFRIEYVLPYTSIIDQNYQVIEDVLKQTMDKDFIKSSYLIKQHHLAEKKYYKNVDENYSYDLTEYLIENWDSKIIVTTFVQFLNTLLSNKNRALKKFYNLSNAIIILDEVQSIPYKYWKLINRVLKITLENLNSYVILVTATMPLLFDLKKDHLIELVPNKEKYFRGLRRIVLDRSLMKQNMTLEVFGQTLVRDINCYQEKSFLIVLNTIKSSIKTFDILKKALDSEHNELVYLSSNIVPKERMNRINAIKERIQHKHRSKKQKRLIIISTQMIEAGVDIDIDCVYRDFAPLDCIIQTAGRCNRNAIEEQGIVKLVRLVNDQENQIYADYVYDEVLLDVTERVLNRGEELIQENQFLDLGNAYYEMMREVKSEENSENILRELTQLRYATAFEGKDKFQLIDKAFRTIDVFLEIDSLAVDIYQEYLRIQEIEDKWQKREAFDKIKVEFLNYVLSVPQSIYEGKLDQGIEYIALDEIDIYYDYTTGFKRERLDIDYFF